MLIFVFLEILHKYDGFVYPEPTTLDRLFSSGGHIMDDRRAFFKKFFLEWKSLYLDLFDDTKLTEALEKLECLYEGTVATWTSDTYRHTRRHTVDDSKLKLWQVGLLEMSRR